MLMIIVILIVTNFNQYQNMRIIQFLISMVVHVVPVIIVMTLVIPIIYFLVWEFHVIGKVIVGYGLITQMLMIMEYVVVWSLVI